MSDAAQPLLTVRDLDVRYGIGRRAFQAVHGVGFDIDHGETVGLVGESGSGKTSIARAVQGLLPPAGGEIRIEGEPVAPRTTGQRRALAAQVQTVFQDPFGSLNPARRIGSLLEEPLRVQEPRIDRGYLRRRIGDELARVGLEPDAASKYPRQFSGGQRQRIAIARAIITRPRLIVCDEAVSALDLSIQAQILNLLSDLQIERGIGYLFITHDLAVVRHVARRIVVLDRGRVVDLFTTATSSPDEWSPYTRKLFDAAPVPDPDRQRERRAAYERLVAAERPAAAPGPTHEGAR